MLTPIERARILRDQVMKTWNPPMRAEDTILVTAVQTATMQTLAFIFGKDICGGLTPPQQTSIDQGTDLLERVLLSGEIPEALPDTLKDYGSNAGVRCDTDDGPCACGAWH